MSRFSSDGADARQGSIDGIAASDTPADLPRALGAAADALRDRKNPLIVLVADGAFPEQQLGLVDVGRAPGQARRTARPRGGRPHAASTSATSRRPSQRQRRHHRVQRAPLHREQGGVRGARRDPELRQRARARASCTLSNGANAVDSRRRSTSRPASASARSTRSCRRATTTSCAPRSRQVDGNGRQRSRSRSTTPPTRCCPARKKQKVLMVTDGQPVPRGRAARLRQRRPAARSRRPSTPRSRRLADGMDVVVFDDYTPDALPPPPRAAVLPSDRADTRRSRSRGELVELRASPRSTRITRSCAG